MKILLAGYTIGRKDVYDSNIKDCESTLDVLIRMGASDSYRGGWMWKTEQEAREFIETSNLITFEADVYGVHLFGGWHNDVSSEPGEDGAYSLLVDRPIFKLS